MFSIWLGPLRLVPTAHCAGRRGLNLLTAVRPVKLAHCQTSATAHGPLWTEWHGSRRPWPNNLGCQAWLNGGSATMGLTEWAACWLTSRTHNRTGGDAGGSCYFVDWYKPHKTCGKRIYVFNQIISPSRILFHLTHFPLQLMSAIDHSQYSYHLVQCPIKPIAGTSWRTRGGNVCLWYKIRMIALQSCLLILLTWN